MKSYISHKRSECIGCALCTEVAPDYFEMNATGEAKLRQIIRQQGHFDYAEGYAPDLARLQAAEAGCPVNIIRNSITR